MASPKMMPFPHPFANARHGPLFWLLLLALTTMTTTTTTTGSSTMAQAQVASSTPYAGILESLPTAFYCPAEGLFADDYDCRIYYRCEQKTNDYIKPYMFACKAGTVFSRDLKLCMPPLLAGRAECDHYMNEIDMDGGDDGSRLMYGIANNGNAMASQQLQNYGLSGLGGVSVISFSTSAMRSAGSADEQGPPCEQDGFMSDPDDCTVFYRCISTGHNFNKIGFRCSDGTAWDETLQSCNHMHNVFAKGGCRERTEMNEINGEAITYAGPATTTQSAQTNFQNTTMSSSSNSSNQQSSTSSSMSSSSSTTSSSNSSSSSSSSSTSASNANTTQSSGNSNNNQQSQQSSTETNAANNQQSNSSTSSNQSSQASNSESNNTQNSNSNNQSNNSNSQSNSNSTNNCLNEETYFPDASDCAKFYRCRDNGNGGLEKVPFTCGPGTIWNQEDKACDFPTTEQKEKCKLTSSSSGNESSSSSTQSSGSGSGSQSSNTENQSSSNNNQSTTSSANQSSQNSSQSSTTESSGSSGSQQAIQKPSNPEGDCKDSETYLPDKTDCGRFYRCVDNGNGGFSTVGFDCAPGTVWDADLKGCNYPTAVQKEQCRVMAASQSSTSQQSSGESNASGGSHSTTQSSSSSTSQQSSTGSNTTGGNQSTTQSSSSNTNEQSSTGTSTTGSNQSTTQSTSSTSNQQTSTSSSSIGSSGTQTSTQQGQNTSSSSSSTQQTTTSQGGAGSTETTGSSTESSSSSTQGSESNKPIQKPPTKPAEYCESENTFLADKENCAKFYRCVDNGKGGFTKVSFDCPPGTVWDPEANSCNHPALVQNLKCKMVSTTGTQQQQQTGGSGSTTQSSSGISSSSSNQSTSGSSQNSQSTTTQGSTSQQSSATTQESTNNSQNSTTTQGSISNQESSSSQQGSTSSTQETTTGSQSSATQGSSASNQSSTTQGSSGTQHGSTSQQGSTSTQESTTSSQGSTTTQGSSSSQQGSNNQEGSTTTQESTTTTGQNSSTSHTSSSTQQSNHQGISSGTSTSKPTGDCNSNTQFLGDEQDCAKFYRCVENGKGSFDKVPFTCGPGTVWDQSIEACNHAWAVKDRKCGVTKPQKPPTTSSSTTNKPLDPQMPEPTTIKPIISSSTPPPIYTEGICKQEGFIGDPKDCTVFYRCVSNGKSGFTQYPFKCGKGTVWDNNLQTCNHDLNMCRPSGGDGIENSTFKPTGKPTENWTPTVPPTKPMDSTSQQIPGYIPTTVKPQTTTDSGKYPETSTGMPTTTTKPIIPNEPISSGTSCTKEGFFGDKHDCQKFYRCVDNGDGTFNKYPFTCGNNTVWDADIEGCNHPTDVQDPRCRQESTTSAGGYETTTTSPGYYPTTTTAKYDTTTSDYDPKPTSTTTGKYPPTTQRPEISTTTNTPTYPTTFTTGKYPTTTIAPEISTTPTDSTTSKYPTTTGMTTESSTSEYTTTISPIPNLPPGTKCKGEGFMADPNDCRRFYRCVRNGDSYSRHEFTCAKGTGWSEEKQTCDHASNIERCGGQIMKPDTTTKYPHDTTTDKYTTSGYPSTTPSYETPTTAAEASTINEVAISAIPPYEKPTTTTGKYPTEPTKYPTITSTTNYPTTTMMPTSSTPIPNLPPGTKCKAEGFMPDPNDCRKFYRCVQNGDTFVRHEFTCAKGTGWSEDKQTCDYAANVDRCDGQTEEPGTEIPTSTQKPTEIPTKYPIGTTQAPPGYSPTTGKPTTEYPTASPTKPTTQGPPGYPPTTEYPTAPPTKPTTQGPPGYPPTTGQPTTEYPTVPPTKPTTQSPPGYPPTTEYPTAPPTKPTTQGPPGYPPTTGQPTTEYPTVPPTKPTTQSPPGYPPTTGKPTTDYPTTPSTTSTTMNYPTTTIEPANHVCSAEGFFPDPEDCNRYYRCVDAKQNGQYQIYSFRCPDSTVWDPTLEICNYPDQVTGNCSTSQSLTTTTGEYPTTTTTSKPTTSPIVTTTSTIPTTHVPTTYPPTVTTTAQPPTTKPITTTQSTPISSGNEPCPQTEAGQHLFVCPAGFRRHPKSCDLFYQCTEKADSHDLSVVVFACPNGTVYHEQRNLCDKPATNDHCQQSAQQTRAALYEEQVRRINMVQIRSTAPLCPDAGHFSLNNDDCSQLFVKCSYSTITGRLEGQIQRCPQGFAYWAISRRCERTQKLMHCTPTKYDISDDIPIEWGNIGNRRRNLKI